MCSSLKQRWANIDIPSSTVQGVTPKAPELYDPFFICIKVALIKKEGPYMSTMHTCDMHADHNNKNLLNQNIL